MKHSPVDGTLQLESSNLMSSDLNELLLDLGSWSSGVFMEEEDLVKLVH